MRNLIRPTTTLLAVLALAASLAACSPAVEEQPASTATQQQPVKPARAEAPEEDRVPQLTPFEADGETGEQRTHPACEKIARYQIVGESEDGPWVWVNTGQVVDTGENGYATGTPSADLTTYTVRAGDTIHGIGDRFCVDHANLMTINHLGHQDPIHAGDTLALWPSGPAEDYRGPWMPE